MLVIGITSRALFDLDLSHDIFTKEGLESYRSFQISNENVPLKPGRAFPLLKKLLSLNNHIEGKRVNFFQVQLYIFPNYNLYTLSILVRL